MTMPTLLMQRAHDEAMADDAPRSCLTSLGGGRSPPSTSWPSLRSTTPVPVTATRAPSCAVKACIPATSWSGAGPVTAGRGRPGPTSGGPRPVPDAAALAKANQQDRTPRGVTWPSTSWPWTSWEKLTRSWRCLPRARPTTPRPRPTRCRAEAVIDACFAELVPLVGHGGRRVGVRASPGPRHYRRCQPPILGPPRPRSTPSQRPVSRRRPPSCWPCCARPGFVTWPRPRCGPSCSTKAAMWRRSPPCTGSLRAGGEVRERRAQATHPTRARPELMADRPNMCWSVGHYQAARPGQGRVVRPLRDHRHLLPLRRGLDGRHDRDRGAGRSSSSPPRVAGQDVDRRASSTSTPIGARR